VGYRQRLDVCKCVKETGGILLEGGKSIDEETLVSGEAAPCARIGTRGSSRKRPVILDTNKGCVPELRQIMALFSPLGGGRTHRLVPGKGYGVQPTLSSKKRPLRTIGVRKRTEEGGGFW